MYHELKALRAGGAWRHTFRGNAEAVLLKNRDNLWEFYRKFTVDGGKRSCGGGKRNHHISTTTGVWKTIESVCVLLVRRTPCISSLRHGRRESQLSTFTFDQLQGQGPRSNGRELERKGQACNKIFDWCYLICLGSFPFFSREVVKREREKERFCGGPC